MQRPVPAVRDAAPADLLHRQAKPARISESEAFGTFHHEGRNPPLVVSVDERVDQGLPDRLVDVSLVDALDTVPEP